MKMITPLRWRARAAAAVSGMHLENDCDVA